MTSRPNHTDFVGNRRKRKVNLDTLDLLRDPSRPNTLFDPDTGFLTCQVMDLAGKHAQTFRLLLDEGLIQPGKAEQYIGVDRVPEIVRGCKEHYADRPEARWILRRDINSLLVGRDRFPGVGVLLYDAVMAYEGLASGRNKVVERNLKHAVAFARARYKALGGFLLIINIVGRGSAASRARYRELLSHYLNRPVVEEHLHKYTSKSKPMFLARIPFGF